MTYITIPDSSLEEGKPARGIDIVALRDNPIAIANGDAGAPKIQLAALVGGGAHKAIGTYIQSFTGSSVAAGSTVSGSSLNGVTSGTWRNMHYTNGNFVTIYLRIA